MYFEADHLESILANAVAANGYGAAHDVGAYTVGGLQVTGTFVLDVQVQISNDNSTWVNLGAVVDAPGFVSLSLYFRYIRVRVLNRVSGTVTVRLVSKR